MISTIVALALAAAAPAKAEEPLESFERTAVLVRTLSYGSAANTHRLRVAADGKSLAGIGQDKVVRLWDPDTGALRAEIPAAESFNTDAGFDPTGRRLAIGSTKGLQLVDSRSGKTVGFYRLDEGNIYTSQPRRWAFSADGSLLAAPDKNYVRVWKAESGSSVREFKFPDKRDATAVAFTPDSGKIVAGEVGEQKLMIADVKSGDARWSRSDPCANNVQKIAVTPDGATALTVNADQQLCAWDLRNGSMERMLGSGVGYSWGPVVSKDGSFALTYTWVLNDAHLDLWDLPQRRLRAKLPCDVDQQSQALVALAPDQSWAAAHNVYQDRSGNYVKEVDVYDTATGALKVRAPLEAYSLAASPDGRSVLIGQFTDRLMDPETGRSRSFLTGDSSYSSAVMPGSGLLVTTDISGEIRFFRPEAAPPADVPRPTAPAALSASARLITPRGDGRLRHGERAAVRVELRNSGEGAANEIHVLARAKPFVPGIVAPPEARLQTLAAGATAAVELPLTTTESLRAGTAKISVEVSEGNGFDAAPAALEFPTAAFEPAALEVARLAADEGPIEPAKTVRLRVTVRNAGGTLARGTTAGLVLGDANIFQENPEPVVLGDLGPGAEKTAEFKFFVGKRYAGSPRLPVFVGVRDAEGRYGFSALPLGLKLGAPVPAAPPSPAPPPPFDLERGAVIADGKGLHHVVISPDGRLAAAGNEGAKVSVWDIATGAVKAEFELSLPKDAEFYPQAFTPDGKGLLVISEDNLFRFDLATKKRTTLWAGTRTRYEIVHTTGPFARDWHYMYNTLSYAAFSPDGRTLALGGCYEKDEEAMLLDAASGALRPLPSGSGCVEGLTFSPDGALVAFARRQNLVEVWDAASGTRRGTYPIEKFPHDAAFSPDGRTLAVAGADKYVVLIDLASGRQTKLDGFTGYDVYSLAYSPDGRWLVAGGNDTMVFDAASGEAKASFKSGYTRSFSFMPDGRLLVAQGDSLLAYGLGGSAAAPRPTTPPKLSATVEFRDPAGAGVLQPGVKGQARVTIANDGQGKAYAVRVSALALSGAVRTGAPVFVGELAPGARAVKSVELTAMPEATDGSASVRVEVREGNGFDAAPSVLELPVRAARAPKLEVASVSLAEGVVKVNELSRLNVTVRNAGEGTARGASARLNLSDPDIFPGGDTVAPLGDLAPGAVKKVSFQFFVNARFKGAALPIALDLSDGSDRGAKAVPLGLAVGQAPAARVVTVKARPEAAAAPSDDEDVDSPPAAKTPPDPQAYAVVVGVERYRQEGLPGVDYAARDARAMRDYLVGAMGFDAKNVVLLLNEGAAKTDLDKYFGPWLKNRADSKSRVFVYFAGHGAPDPASGEGYLVPYDGDPSYVKDTAFPLARLYDALSGLPAKSVSVVLDACFSGRGQRSLIAKGTRPLVHAAALPPLGERVTVIAATGAEQISVFSPEHEHGLLTYHLLRGLKGKADAAHDGRITTEELFRYLRPEVERDARLQNTEQSPTITPPLESLGARGRELWVKLK